MNEEIINELLEQLKSNLQNVESAKQQVEDTVGAYNALENDVEKFVTDLGFITQNTRTIISQLEDVKKNFLANVSTQLAGKIDKGVNDISSTIEATSTEINKLQNTAISSIDSSKASLDSAITAKVQDIKSDAASNKQAILSDIQSTKTTVTGALSASEQRILKQVQEKSNVIEESLSSNSSSIKNVIYIGLAISFITLCMVGYLISKI